MKFSILLVFLLILSCTMEKKETESDLNYFPPNATVFIKINHPDSFKSELKNNGFMDKMKATSLFASIRRKMDALDFNKIGQNSILAFYPVGKGNHEFILLQALDSIPLNLERYTERKVETLNYENRQITTYHLDDSTFYGVAIDGKSIISSSQLLLENVIRTKGENQIPKALERLFQTANTFKSASLFFNMQTNSLLSSELKTVDEANMGIFADWVSTDFTTQQGDLLLSGVAVANDSTKKFINLFKGTAPLVDRTASIAPQNAFAIASFSFNDHEMFLNNQKDFLDVVSLKKDMALNIEEVGVIYLNAGKAVVVHAIDDEGLNPILESAKVNATNYQGSEIWRLNDDQVVEDLFGPLTKKFKSNFYTVFENAHIFTTDLSALQNIIANKRSGFTFDKGSVYKEVKSRIGSESSLLFISGEKGLNHFLGQHFNPNLAKELQAENLEKIGFAAQLINDRDFSHFNVLVTKIQNEPANKSVAPIFNLELDSDLVTDPHFVKNHRTNKHEVVVQDQDNYLYLISTEGKVLWKRQLEGKIQGRIHQVDIYKNGKLQLAFCTNNQFLVLDRNGEEVAPFNKKFEGGNLNPLAVFDYEKNRNYRFVVTQGKKVYMYNSAGDIVSGFTYTEAESPVISNPKHFRMGKKDYLVFQLENGQLKILHRAGGNRITVNRTIAFSDNEVFLYKNKFSVTDKKGVLHQVDIKGKLSATKFNLGENHGMFATSKTLVFMDDNILNIKGKKVELELGVYTKPKIFYINDKIYVAVTDLQNQKIHLYDSQAKPIPNFPVYGNSVVDLIDMDNDKKLELVAKDQENSIIVYTLN